MADDKYYPDEWKEFCALVKSGSVEASPALSRFAARYRAAGNYQRAEFMGMSGDVCDGYSAVIKVMLCYSALEVLCGALGLTLADQVVVTSPAGGYAKCPAQLRAEYGGASSTEFPLRAALTNRRLVNRLDAFIAGTSDDLLPVATALRHLFVHGAWTPSGGETVSKRATRALTDLAQILLWHCDTVFTTYVCSLKGTSDSARPDVNYKVKGLSIPSTPMTMSGSIPSATHLGVLRSHTTPVSTRATGDALIPITSRSQCEPEASNSLRSTPLFRPGWRPSLFPTSSAS